MAFKNKKNFAISELASSMNDSQTSATVKVGEGVKFPSTNFWFIVDVEIMLCSSRTDDVLTVTRGQQSTSAAAHNTAARCYNSPTIACVEDLEAEVKQNKFDATQAPTVNDDSGDGYAVGSRWIDVTNDKEYVCLDATVGTAVWTETTQSGGGGVDQSAVIKIQWAFN